MKTIEIFQAATGEIEFRGDVEHETIWASQKQIAELFAIDRTVVSKHIKNIFKDGELDQTVVCAKFAHTTSHGAIESKTQTRELDFYNLDIILAIGYRTNSKKAIDFRKWASLILKKYLINGYAINEKKLTQTKELLNNLKATIEFLSSKEIEQEKEILHLLKTYTKTLSLLESYDKSSIEDFEGRETSYQLTYSEAKGVLSSLKTELIKKGEATELFANEKADELDGKDLSMEIMNFKTLEKRLIKLDDNLVLLYKDVAQFYDIEPKKLRQQLKRNIEKFPKDIIEIEFDVLKDKEGGCGSW